MITKRTALFAGAVALLLLGAVSLRSRLEAREVQVTPTPREVLIFTCVNSAPAAFLHQGSSGAPAVNATTCAQGLADALNAGFSIESTTSLAGPGAVYTLVRGGGGDD